IVNVALPRLQEDLDASPSDLQWIVDAYSLLFAGTLLLAGSLGDRFGRRRLLVIGLGVFGVCSLAAALAPDAATLTACRAVMGIGGACIMPSTLSI
ncbi:MAG: MFS transporter, partial [Acidimicrobiales bacterium]|nr:MFS transporter [Acidimicrobiales bacterium]